MIDYQSVMRDRTCSNMILLICLLFTTTLAQESPLEKLIKDAIYATNKANFENHRDLLQINGFKYNDIVDLEVGKISASNFSTIALKGTPDVKQVEKKDGISYYFDVAVGLDILQLGFDYKFSFSFLSSSGAVKLKNSGNGLRTRGVVNTFHGTSKPCNAVLQAVEIDSFGSMEVEFDHSGVLSWFLGRLVQFAYSVGESYATPMINQMIAEKVQAAEFQTMFSELACSVFNL